VTSLRRQARITALQTLYELDCTQHKAEQALSCLTAEQSLPPEAVDFAGKLVQGVLQNKSKLDSFVSRFAPSFPVEQMSIIDRNILRIAIYEILINNNTPVKVAINEAVELAKSFGSDASPRLINGVLGTIASKYGKA